MTIILTSIAYITAVALALFSGSVSMIGLMKFAPGAEWVVAVMAALFEAGKLTAFALLHKRMPILMKGALLALGLVLMSLNIAGVSGFLSNAYEREQTAIHAVSHATETEARTMAASLERQLMAAENAVADARAALGKAKGDRDQIKAVTGTLTTATKERDALAEKLAAAQTRQAKAEGATIAASAEFAAIAFIAAATGGAEGTVAHIVILTIASLPDLAAVLLLLGAGFTTREAITIKPATQKQTAYYKGLETQIRKLKMRNRALSASGPRLVKSK